MPTDMSVWWGPGSGANGGGGSGAPGQVTLIGGGGGGGSGPSVIKGANRHCYSGGLSFSVSQDPDGIYNVRVIDSEGDSVIKNFRGNDLIDVLDRIGIELERHFE